MLFRSPASTHLPRAARFAFGWIGRWLCVVGGCSSASAVIVGGITAQPALPDPGGPYQVIRLGGQEAAIVPLADLGRLQAVERLAPAEVVESAEIESTLSAQREWVAASRPARCPKS